MIKIILDTGRMVKVEAFSYGYTYGGLLEGTPNERMNRNIFERTTYPSNWGPRKVLKIQPNKDEFINGLKPTYYSIWLTSYEPINPEYHGSALVVIWFGSLPNGKTIEEIIENKIKSIDWKKHAQDFEY